ncbi:MAG: hypothetical protein HND58_04165 [Planctomycetota bacterium]|nr:MAG: hypothetical protein HND58_04165 [Planctomycetota bacterium]
MKKILGVLAVGCLAGSAMAGPQVRFYNTDGSDNEDGFTADLGANGYSNPTGDYVTFCVETLEHFGYGTTYEYLISDQVRDNGGNGNLALNTQAGRRVAWLYKEFATGGAAAIRALDAAFSGFTDQQTRELLQRYIWDRFAIPSNDNWQNGTFTDAMFDTMTTQADAGGAQSGLHNVRVMNIYSVGHNGDDAYGGQDMLVIIPLPSGAGLASVGLLGLAAARRRRA